MDAFSSKKEKMDSRRKKSVGKVKWEKTIFNFSNIFWESISPEEFLDSEQSNIEMASYASGEILPLLSWRVRSSSGAMDSLFLCHLNNENNKIVL